MAQTVIEDFLRHLEVERGLSPHTISAYRSDLTLFSSSLAARTLESVTQSDCMSFLGQLQDQGYAASSVGRMLAALKTFFRFLHSEGVLKENPIQLLESPKQWQTVPQVLTEEQVARLLAQPASDTYQGALDRAILEVLYSTGLRVSELCRLTLDCVDDRAVRVFGKGGRERMVPIGKQAIASIDYYLIHFRNEQISREVDDWLFLTPQSRAINRYYVWWRLKLYAEAAGLPDHISPHTLRHSYATHLLANGADISVIKELLGHANIKTTDGYTRVDDRHVRTAFEACHPRLGG